MMHGLEKSDPAIVATKPANKAGKPVAEWVEPRAGTEGNTGQPRTRRTQRRCSVSPGLERVRQAARQRKKEKFTALLHHVTVDLLRDAFLALKRRAAPGVDGVTWEDYEAGLEDKLQSLHQRSKTASSGRWGSPRWRTRSSNVRWSRCSARSTRKTSSGSRTDFGRGAVNTMRSMH